MGCKDLNEMLKSISRERNNMYFTWPFRGSVHYVVGSFSPIIHWIVPSTNFLHCFLYLMWYRCIATEILCICPTRLLEVETARRELKAWKAIVSSTLGRIPSWPPRITSVSPTYKCFLQWRGKKDCYHHYVLSLPVGFISLKKYLPFIRRILFNRNTCAFSCNNIAFFRKVTLFPRNIISFPRNIIARERNSISM